MENSKVLDFEQFLSQVAKKKLQISLPEKVEKLISEYQVVHRRYCGRHISKEKVIHILISLSADEMQAAISQIKKEFEHEKDK